MQLIGNSILIGDEMCDDILSPAQQAFLRESKSYGRYFVSIVARPLCTI